MSASWPASKTPGSSSWEVGLKYHSLGARALTVGWAVRRSFSLILHERYFILTPPVTFGVTRCSLRAFSLCLCPLFQWHKGACPEQHPRSWDWNIPCHWVLLLNSLMIIRFSFVKSVEVCVAVQVFPFDVWEIHQSKSWNRVFWGPELLVLEVVVQHALKILSILEKFSYIQF